jgi:PKD repeat protein
MYKARHPIYALMSMLAAVACGVQHHACALSFAPPVNYPGATQLSGMAMGDLNGDGNLDFVTANDTSQNFTVFLGKPDGTLQAGLNTALTGRPLYVAIADFNGDNKLDLAFTCYGSNDVKVLLGNGDGTFGAPLSLPAGNNSRGIVTGDFNNDAKQDIAITNVGDNTVEIYLGNGDGTFQSGVTFAVGANPGAIAAAQLDGDGNLDLVTSNYFDTNCSVLLGNGDGTFAPAVQYAADSNPSDVAIHDLNNDGIPDIVISNHAGNLSVLIGNGDGTFKPQVKYAVGANPLRVVFDDFNNDGAIDIGVALYDDAKIAILLGKGDGTFNAPLKSPVGAGSGELFVADLNHDGLDDLIVAQQNATSVGVLLQAFSVTGISFTPGAVLTAAPTQLTATLSNNANPATATASTVELVRAGPDGVLGTVDDVAITPNGVSVNGSQISMDLTGVTLPNDKYRFTLKSDASFKTSLLAGWSFDEGSGVSAADLSGHANGATLHGSAGWSSGLQGSSLLLSSPGDYADFGTAAGLNFAAGTPFTYSLWFKTTDAFAPIISQRNSTDGGAVIDITVGDTTFDAGKIVAQIRNDSALNQPYAFIIGPVINDGNWHYAAATRDSTGNVELFLDGASVGTGANSGGPITTDLRAFGSERRWITEGLGSSDNQYFSGQIDLVRVFNRKLSRQEITTLAQGVDCELAGVNGAKLDGKFSGAFPSGDGTYNDFSADFQLQVPTIWVTSMSPAPASTQTSAPATITVTTNIPTDPSTVNVNTVKLVRAGPDGVFGTVDDIAITPAGVSVNGTQIAIDLTGVKLPDDKYQVTLASGKGAAPTNGLAAYWNFDEGSGTTVFDSSGNAINGSMIGCTWTTGVSGKALSFGVTGSVVNLGAADIAPPWTASVWVNRQETTRDSSRLMGANTAPSALKLEQYYYTKKVGVTVQQSADYAFNYIAPLNSWVHLTYVGTATNTSLYVNGIFQDSIPVSIPMPMGSISHAIESVCATLDEFRVYNRVLSPQEIMAVAGFGVADANGNPLDGKFTGTFPSGDGIFANFNAGFTLTTPKLTLTGLTPAPNSTLVTPISTITTTFSKPIDPASATASTVRLIGAGPDGQFGTADDLTVTPNSVNVAADGLSATLDLTEVNLSGGQYQLRVSGKNGSAPTIGLAAYWKFDEGNGTQALDSSGHNNSGVLSAPIYTSGVAGTALQFNGVNDSVKFTRNATLEPTTAITVCCWANVTSTRNGVAADLVRKTGPFQQGYLLRWSHNDGVLQWRLDRANNPPIYVLDTQPNSAYLNAWHHFAGTYDAASGVSRLYVDGVLHNSLTGQHGNVEHTDDLYLMYVNYQFQVATPGMLDDVRIYNRALSASEIAGLASPGIADLNGNPLDGKFSGTFPSGDGTFADFVANVRIDNPPVANAQALAVHSNGGLPLTISASDPDNDPLTYTVLTQPAHGTLVGSAPNLIYIPGSFAGSDSFTFKANDGTVDSNIAIVTIDATDLAPVAVGGAAVVHSGAVTPVVLSASDPDGDPFAYSLVSLPAHGTLTGTLPNLIYTASGFTGTDSFMFKANDGVLDSNIATFTITISDNAPTVTASASPTSILEFDAVSFYSIATDPDGDALTVSWDFGDGGTSSDANPAHTYTAAGMYTATVTVTDIGGLSASASVGIHVHQQAELPTARFVTSDLTGFGGQPVGFDATFSTDPDNNIVSYDWDFGDGSRHGSGQLISRIYTAPGTYTVRLTITNGFGLSDSTTLTMVVLPAADAGLFPSSLSYSVSWNRAVKSADKLKLTATVNIGDVVLTKATPLTLGIVGQMFSGTAGTSKLQASSASSTAAGVKWAFKPGKKGSPKGTFQLQASVSHATVGLAFAQAGALGSTTAHVRIPVMLKVGAATFQTPINSQFRFGPNGQKASGGGTGPK